MLAKASRSKPALSRETRARTNHAQAVGNLAWPVNTGTQVNHSVTAPQTSRAEQAVSLLQGGWRAKRARLTWRPSLMMSTLSKAEKISWRGWWMEQAMVCPAFVNAIRCSITASAAVLSRPAEQPRR